jgi:hypothetical protein
MCSPSYKGGGVILTIQSSAKRRCLQFLFSALLACMGCWVFDHLFWTSSIAGARDLDAVGYPPASQFNLRSSSPDVSNIDKKLRVITQFPHPMGSSEQKRLARWMVGFLNSRGWKAEEQRFTVKTPSGAAKEPKLVTRTGRNVIASRAGPDECVFIIGGHYDSKYFPPEIRFVGANDGGSSTALMLELARLWTHPAHALSPKLKSGGTWFDCDVVLAFFDGEESFLPEWTDGETLLGVRDNLYGSRDFVNRLVRAGPNLLWRKKPVKLFLNLDMIGHKNQNLFITEGSDNLLSEQLIALRGSVPIKKVPLAVEDDHIPFMRLGIPFIHVIDWTNLQEWHTPKDTPDIVSSAKIAALIEVVMKFSERKRP